MRERDRIIAAADSRGDFVTDADGFVYWFPSGRGHLAAHHLRWIADELDRRNAPQCNEINEYFSRTSEMGSHE